MTRLAAAALLMPLLAAAPVTAQSIDLGSSSFSARWKSAAEPMLPLDKRGIALPVIDYAAPDGSIRMKRGIVAGMEIAPNALLGIGLFEMLPKKRSLTAPDHPLEMRPRRSRKAAVGISFAF